MPKPFEGKPQKVFGWASFFNDFGSDMVFPVWPAFVTQTLGASTTFLGFLDGLGDALVAISQLISGIVSDRIKKHKVFIWLGYCGGVLGRVGYALAQTSTGLIVPKILDRSGKMREAPRDAIVAEMVKEGERGKAFGFIRSMDHAGAVLGIIVAFALLQFFHIPVRTLFLIAAVPSVVSVLLVFLFISEPKHAKEEVFERKKVSFVSLRSNPVLRWVFAIFIVFGLANMSYSFLLLAAHRIGWPVATLPLLYLLFSFFAALSAQPFGRFADRFGSKVTILIGFALLAAAFLIGGTASSIFFIPFAFICYGLHKGAIEPSQRSFVASFAGEGERATVFGTLQFTLGITAIPASLIAGALWDMTGSPLVSFLAAGGLLLVSALLLTLLKVPNRGVDA
jgi:MFS family permease